MSASRRMPWPLVGGSTSPSCRDPAISAPPTTTSAGQATATASDRRASSSAPASERQRRRCRADQIPRGPPAELVDEPKEQAALDQGPVRPPLPRRLQRSCTTTWTSRTKFCGGAHLERRVPSTTTGAGIVRSATRMPAAAHRGGVAGLRSPSAASTSSRSTSTTHAGPGLSAPSARRRRFSRRKPSWTANADRTRSRRAATPVRRRVAAASRPPTCTSRTSLAAAWKFGDHRHPRRTIKARRRSAPPPSRPREAGAPRVRARRRRSPSRAPRRASTGAAP